MAAARVLLDRIVLSRTGLEAAVRLQARERRQPPLPGVFKGGVAIDYFAKIVVL